MAIYTNLPIYKSSYSLLLSLTRISTGIPREFKYTLAQDCKRRIMDILILIYRANRNHHKLDAISEMREKLLEVQVYIRLLSDLRCISERQYTSLAEQTVSMSKQMAAWEKSEKDKHNGGDKNKNMLQAGIPQVKA